MKKIIELKTVRKEIFKNSEQYEKKLSKLKYFCFIENKRFINGQCYYIEVLPDNNSATLFLEINTAALFT